jgi:hypothetical protein
MYGESEKLKLCLQAEEVYSLIMIHENWPEMARRKINISSSPSSFSPSTDLVIRFLRLP